MPRKLTPTSYAVLSQVALRSWSTYELAKHMQRNLRFFYPRAESRIYAEVKTLAEAQLVRVERSQVGRRARTSYSITPKGLAELRRWLADGSAKGPLLEFEGLLRVFVAHLGTRDDLATTLSRVDADIWQLTDVANRVADEYLAGRAPFQQFVHERALVFDFLFRFAHLVHDWTARVDREIAGWSDVAPEGKAEQGRQLIAATIAEFGALRRPPAPR